MHFDVRAGENSQLESAAVTLCGAWDIVGEFQRLLQNIRMGDGRALDRLLALWRPILRRNAHGKLGPSTVARADTSDVVQNTLLKATESIFEFRGNSEGEWAVWLRTILARQAGKIHRFHHTKKRTVKREDAIVDSSSALTDPSEPVLQSVELDHLQRAIDSLPPPMKEIVCRRLLDREPYELIAHELNITTGYARVLLTRALRRLRELIDKEQ